MSTTNAEERLLDMPYGDFVNKLVRESVVVLY
jgi:hypothetical protein